MRHDVNEYRQMLPNLSKENIERLTLFFEECSEAGAEAINFFLLNSAERSPEKGVRETEKELGDVFYALKLMAGHKDIDEKILSFSEINQLDSELIAELMTSRKKRFMKLNQSLMDLIQLTSKILRHGFESCHPEDENKISNRVNFEKEILNFLNLLEIMELKKDIKLKNIFTRAIEKENKIDPYLHHNNPHNVAGFVKNK